MIGFLLFLLREIKFNKGVLRKINFNEYFCQG